MPRIERIEYEGTQRWKVIVEQYTRVCRLPNGIVLRHDGKDLWDTGRGGSWYGRPPADWDESLAVDEAHTVEALHMRMSSHDPDDD